MKLIAILLLVPSMAFGQAVILNGTTDPDAAAVLNDDLTETMVEPGDGENSGFFDTLGSGQRERALADLALCKGLVSRSIGQASEAGMLGRGMRPNGQLALAQCMRSRGYPGYYVMGGY